MITDWSVLLVLLIYSSFSTFSPQEMCIEFVDQHLDEIVEKVAHMDTKDVCISLHLCDASTNFKSFISTVAASSACNSCKYFVKRYTAGAD